jgi:hypothetical protein
MAIGRTEDRDTPWDPVMCNIARVFRSPVRATHLGQRSIRSHTQAGHMTAIDQTRPSCIKSLRARGPFSNRSSAVKTSFTSPARVTVLSAVSTSCRNFWSGREAPALQGPQRAYA